MIKRLEQVAALVVAADPFLERTISVGGVGTGMCEWAP